MKWFSLSVNITYDNLDVFADNNITRNFCRKGRIIRIFLGKDCKVKIVKMQTSASVFQGPVNKVVKVEQ